MLISWLNQNVSNLYIPLWLFKYQKDHFRDCFMIKIDLNCLSSVFLHSNLVIKQYAISLLISFNGSFVDIRSDNQFEIRLRTFL